MHRVLILFLAASSCTADFSPVYLKKTPLREGRIVGGQIAKIENFPWQVSVRAFKQHSCGGSIIGPNHVLTAAHCISTFWNYLSIKAGSDDQYSGGTIHNVTKVEVHELYGVVGNVDYDIAIIEVTPPFPIGKNVGIVKLQPSNQEIKSGTLANVTGWGLTEEGEGFGSTEMMSVEVPIVSKKECTKAYGKIISNRMLCAGYNEGGKDACQGDSGGPLVIKETQIGIVSWGNGCAHPKYPGVYIKISAFRNWIKTKTGI